MTNAETGLETIIDDELIAAIRNWEGLDAKVKSAEAALNDMPTGQGYHSKLDRTRSRAQADLEDLIEEEREAQEKWEQIVKIQYDGATIIFNGTAYALVSMAGDESASEAKLLMPSGTAPVVANGHHPNATVARCQCGNDAARSETGRPKPRHDRLWHNAIRKAIAARLAAKELYRATVSLADLVACGMESRRHFEAWVRFQDELLGNANDAQDRLVALILAHFGKIAGPAEVATLPDRWTAVSFTIDGETFVVRGSGDDPDDLPGRPTLDITDAASVELVTA